MQSVKVAPEGVLKKPIRSKGGMEMGSLDATYLKRRQDCSDKFFTCKSGRKYCYFTDGSDPAQVQCIEHVHDEHAPHV